MLSSAYSAKSGGADRGDEAATVLIERDHPSLSAEFVRRTVGETPEMPESIKKSLQPFGAGIPKIKTVEELRKIISSLS